jgi:hypothetical protein
VQSAAKQPLEGEAALSVLQGITRLDVAKGSRIVSLDLQKERPGDEELLELLLGRSGKLRAPAVRSGSRLLIGFNPALLEMLLEAG